MTKVYVKRGDGVIQYIDYVNQLGMGLEEMDDTAAEVQAFFHPRPPASSVSARQFKLQLLSAGLLDTVNAWVASQSREVQIAYEYSGTFVKDSPMMTAGFQAMGFTTQQIDAFFMAAAQL
ncbi:MULTISPECIES: hypothetical protein [Rhizobium]|uniref:hypothetical protein n=1 Tax=Rhizobium phaseoli TaxID=396 RepID=UPI000A1C018B|nr:hypothetical protein [Rhizobium phaseoli]ARM14163.1 hypothetical protein Bra5_CH03996 [Rhizobium phaseoli Brasil 5]